MSKKIHPRKAMNDSFNKKPQRKCLMATFPEMGTCSGEIIDAHSISRQHLVEISDATGHFSGYFPVLRKPAMEEFTLGGSIPLPLRAGVNNFGKFPGLCNRHDNDLFASFEKNVFVGTYEQIFGLHIRAILRELWTKNKNNYGMEYLESQLNDVFSYEVAGKKKDRLAKHLDLAHQGVGDLWRELKASVDLRPNSQGSQLKYLHFEMSEQFPLLCATSANPPIDLHGHPIQDYNDLETPLSGLCINYIKDSGGAHCVFSWEDSHPINRLVESFRDRFSLNLSTGLVQLAFLFAENVAFNSSWFENLSTIKQIRLSKIFWSMSPSGTFSKNGGVDQLRMLDFGVGGVQTLRYMGVEIQNLEEVTFYQ
jgi:hypothetical protein